MSQCCFVTAVFGFTLDPETIGADLHDRVFQRLMQGDTNELPRADPIYDEISKALNLTIPAEAVILTTGSDHPAECDVEEGAIVMGVGLLREPWAPPIELSEEFREQGSIITWAQVS